MSRCSVCGASLIFANLPHTCPDHGLLGLGTSWTRALFPSEARHEAEDLIPPHFQINVTPVNGKPGPWRVAGYRVQPWTEVLAWETYSPQNAVRVMADHLREMAVRVEGWALADDMSVSVGLDYTEGVA